MSEASTEPESEVEPEAPPPQPSLPGGPPRRVRCPTVMQVVAAECGAASLCSVLGHFRAYRPLEEVREAVGVDRDGSNARRIASAARHFGLEVEGIKCEVDGFDDVKLPAILFWGLNHFVVLEGWNAREFLLMDPATGRRAVSPQEFDEEFSGVVLNVQPSEQFVPSGGPPSALKLVVDWMRGSGSAVWLSVLLGLLLAVPMVTVPGLAAAFIDQVLSDQRDGWTLSLVGVAVGAMVVEAILLLLQRNLLAQVEQQLSLERSVDFLRQIFRLPSTFFGQRYPGDIAERVTANDQVASMLASQFAPAIVQVLTLMAFLIAISLISTTMGIIAFFAVSATITILVLAARARVDQATALSQQEGMKQGAIVAGLITLESLKAGGRESDFFARSMGFTARVASARQRAALLSNMVSIVPSWLQSVVVSAIVLGVGGLQVMDGEISIGTLLALQILVMGFMSPVTQLAELLREIQTVRADLGRLDDVMCHATDPLASEPDVDHTADIEYAAGQLELRSITFGYGHGQAPLLKDFSLTVRPGGRVAIVGGTGSGKSTVSRLAAGLLEPWDGEVLLDGFPLRSVPRHIRAASLSTVFQRPSFFEGSIRENLSLWNPDIPDAWLLEALDDAQLTAVINSRGGLDHPVAEGASNFSGGEAQRLDIARALCRRPAVVILDEATSALDPTTELAIDAALRRRGTTCLVVAHRLSTIRDADEIVVMDQGEVVERGTHEDLLARRGRYHELITGESHA
ncbi:MAG: ATP-binding cassette domain-containing protein [Planctomycetes bacterium]|nr:ATP-binding cassette domain-containing protein [Planctomycetota bacterium]